ncbi:MAG: hypothetical protein AAF371_17680 [Pseudomonadota bacterium]
MTVSGAEGERDRPAAAAPAHEAGMLGTALEALIGELEAASRRRDRAGLAVEAARHQHATVLAAANRLVCVLPRGSERTLWEDRIEAAAALDSPAAGYARRAGGGAREPVIRPFRRSGSPRMIAVHRFLALEGRAAFRTEELTIHLTMLGFDLPRHAAANTCRRLIRQGIITRIDHALYAINRSHPALAEAELLELRSGG